MTAPDFSTIPRRRRRVLDLALVAASLVLVVLSGRAALSAHARRDAARASLAEVKQEMDAARARLRTLEGRGGPVRGRSDRRFSPRRRPAVGVLMALAGVLPPDVRLDRITLTYGRELALEMGVVARDPRAFDRLLERLDSFPLLRDVRPGAENRAGEVRTIVRAAWSAHP